MKILVSGAKGQVGAELIPRGQRLGLNMIATDISDLDITNHDAVMDYTRLLSPDLIINAAAYTAVDRAEEEIEAAFSINRDGSANLASACLALNIPLFHISTDYVFDGTKAAPYVEDDATNPVSVYGKSKLAGDTAVTRILPQHIILRVAWVFSARGQNFVKTMLKLGRQHDHLDVVSDQHGSPTWAGDIADTLLSIASQYEEQENFPWGTYHYIGTPTTTWFGLAEAIFKQAQTSGILNNPPALHPIPSEEYPTPAKRPKNSVLDCQKINHAFNISQPNWRVGLSNVLNSGLQ